MSKATLSALAILMATGLTVAVDAQARERGVNERQNQQRERVTSGARSGQVTRPEARQLNREARGIERKEQAFRSDGHFSRSERREVHRDLDRHGRHIQQSRNDHDRRGWHGGRDWGHQRGFDRGHQVRGQGGIDRLQHRQQAQIRQGVRNGSLTPHEARRLSGEQRQIAALERSYRADGVLTPAERRDLRGELRDADRHIYNQTHDDDRRFGR
ncbi:MAG: hypothetical protein OEW79_06000 [Betaproteobacteria bacterium]|nr:hypothetical protein [Betaproteobacteria bacterium]MDH5342370.1 hypothetical protein [Betaproteobacteria bacterium]